MQTVYNRIKCSIANRVQAYLTNSMLLLFWTRWMIVKRGRHRLHWCFVLTFKMDGGKNKMDGKEEKNKKEIK